MSLKRSSNTSSKTPNADRKKTASALSRFGLILGGSAVILFALGFQIHNSVRCDYPFKNPRQIETSGKPLKVEAVFSPQDLAQGLSGRPCLSKGQGMLFVFDKPGKYGFWMKDMHFPIDIVWLDETKTITKIELNVQPSTYPKSFRPDSPASFALEVAAGYAQDYGLTSGQQLSFDANSPH